MPAGGPGPISPGHGRITAWAVMAFLLPLTGGCAPTPEEPTPEWTEPAWFAEQARQREEVAQVLQDCMRQHGWDMPVDEYGGIDANLAGLERKDEVIADINGCYSSIPSKYRVNVDADYLRDVLYPQQVDTYECLISHGIQADPPPPAELFVETHLAGAPAEAWIAWGGSWTEEYLSGGEYDMEDFLQLQLDCPQPYVAP